MIADRNNETYLPRPGVLGLGRPRDPCIGRVHMRSEHKEIESYLRWENAELGKIV